MTETGFYPKAIVKNIHPGANDPRILPCGVVLHVRDGLGDSLHDYFDGPSGGVESHFYIRLTGVVEQYRSIFYEADANLDGNSFFLDGERVGFVSFETEGKAAGEWSAEQLATIKALILWVRAQAKAAGVNMPLEECPAWNQPGVGYHTMWGSPSHWTPVAKSCPGPDRIEQFGAVLVPWMAEVSKPPRALFPVGHRVVTANMFVKNRDQAAGARNIVTRVIDAFRLAPDVIGAQEGARLTAIPGYTLLRATEDGEAAREIPVLLLSKWKLIGTEYHHAADGTGTGALDHPRGIFVVKYLKRRRKVAVVNTHMGVIGDEVALEDGTKKPGPAALQHAAHAQQVVRIVRRLKANGYTCFVTADANARGRWSESLPAVLKAAGLHVTRNSVDLVASDPDRVRFAQLVTIGRRLTGSDAHDALAIRTIERKRS